ncbi:ABC transporter permease [Caldalkalibacillus salinus]|uniref:ABC transporter permease n=1 Tax=Caldalkalibacillus salinus TaxID=2803787 RepID=UPI001922702A|nr:ABC transporter permease [Caldalkalibacillus salinus]
MQLKAIYEQWQNRLKEGIGGQRLNVKRQDDTHEASSAHTPALFWVIVRKEMEDQFRSWRFIILFGIIILTCLASLYTALTNIRDVAADLDSSNAYLFLNIFTISDPNGVLPPFITFISFLGPLLGIGLGFDAINAERNRGTLSRIVSQPIPRDYLLNAKFVATLIVISILIFSLGLLVMGTAILSIGLPPTWDEFWRVIAFLCLSVVYIGFWLNLAIFFSVRFKQAATSALASIAVWLFFSIFFSMIVGMVGNAAMPDQNLTPGSASESAMFVQNLSRLNPNYLFSEITTILLTPQIRTLGPLSMEQVVGAIPSPLPLGQSLLLIWPQVTGLVAATVICFGISYVNFMRQEIRA